MTRWNPDIEVETVRYRDPLLTPTTATIDEIEYAGRLRLQLRQRYPDLPSPPPSFWCLGID